MLNPLASTLAARPQRASFVASGGAVFVSESASAAAISPSYAGWVMAAESPLTDRVWARFAVG